jgi:hypothetical protein
MGLLDDAIREHLELKRRSGAAADEVTRLEEDAFGPGGAPPAPEPEAAEATEPVAEPEPEARHPEPEPWLDEPDEVPVEEALDHPRQPTSEFVAPDDEPESEDVLEETPEFLSETPEHDRLWFEQKPPRDFDFGG